MVAISAEGERLAASGLDLTVRRGEIYALLGGQWDSIRPEMLTKMPIVDEETLKARRAQAAGVAQG